MATSLPRHGCRDTVPPILADFTADDPLWAAFDAPGHEAAGDDDDAAGWLREADILPRAVRIWRRSMWRLSAIAMATLLPVVVFVALLPVREAAHTVALGVVLSAALMLGAYVARFLAMGVIAREIHAAELGGDVAHERSWPRRVAALAEAGLRAGVLVVGTLPIGGAGAYLHGQLWIAAPTVAVRDLDPDDGLAWSRLLTRRCLLRVLRLVALVDVPATLLLLASTAFVLPTGSPVLFWLLALGLTAAVACLCAIAAVAATLTHHELTRDGRMETLARRFE